MVFKSLVRLLNLYKGDVKKQSNFAGCLCQDVIEKILILVPLKPRTRFKCVSKSWCSIINELHQNSPPNKSSLVISSCDRLTTLHFSDKLATEVEVFKIRLYYPHSPPILVDSHNGLLLFETSDRFQRSGAEQHLVCNPALDGKDRFIRLPRINKDLGYPMSGFCLDASQNEFKVLCFDLDESSTSIANAREINYYIFSSDKWEWKLHRARMCKPCDLEFGTHSRKLYWMFKTSVLVYDFNKRFFSLIEHPIEVSDDVAHFDRVWESEGYLCFCRSLFDRLILWSYNHGRNEWLQKVNTCYKNIEGGENLEEGLCDTYDSIVLPLAFIEELQILYLHQKGLVFCYSFETQSLTTVWSNPSTYQANPKRYNEKYFFWNIGLYSFPFRCTM